MQQAMLVAAKWTVTALHSHFVDIKTPFIANLDYGQAQEKRFDHYKDRWRMKCWEKHVQLLHLGEYWNALGKRKDKDAAFWWLNVHTVMKN